MMIIDHHDLVLDEEESRGQRKGEQRIKRSPEGGTTTTSHLQFRFLFVLLSTTATTTCSDDPPRLPLPSLVAILNRFVLPSSWSKTMLPGYDQVWDLSIWSLFIKVFHSKFHIIIRSSRSSRSRRHRSLMSANASLKLSVFLSSAPHLFDKHLHMSATAARFFPYSSPPPLPPPSSPLV